MALKLTGLVLPLALCVTAAGCASTGATHGAIHYTDEAQQAYERAKALYDDDSFEEAAEAFRAVRREYSLSRWGYLAELRLADIDFKQERFAEALGAFRAWLRYHASQPEASYARYMVARCYYSQIPDDWVLVPGSEERDLSSVHDAVQSLTRFLHDYPDAPETSEARTMLRNARALMARHEVYVARFYASRERYDAAISRLIGVVQNFSGTDEEVSALLQLGEVYLRTSRSDQARGAFDALVRDHANTDAARAAQRYLARLGPGTSVPVGEGADPEPPPAPPPEETTTPSR